jgi:transcriptional regulator with GAF, ATPase, and Fis domain
LAVAERVGDVAALPPFVMNVATAEHALGEVAAAMERYERAADLAGRLGRAASRAAALVNLAGLLASVEADDDALRVLADARAAAERASAPIYAAQAQLIEAEIEARRDRDVGLARALEASAAFERCGAARQALEAELLAREIEGDPEGVDPWLAARRAGLEEAGLGALDRARREAERAEGLAQESGDRDLAVRALALAAEVHDRLGTHGGEALRARARVVVAELAARMPSGLRERWLARRADLARPSLAPSAASPHAAGLGPDARRLLDLVGRVLLEPNEARVLELALDEAVALARAERAFLLLRRGPDRRPDVALARNLDRDSIRSGKLRFSRSVAERVLSSGEPLVTASASDDPELRSSRSVLDLGLRSILCVPVRAPTGVIAALYLDHRFETARFGEPVREMVQALADVIGLALENGRLHREAQARREELERAHAALRLEADRKDAELDRLTDALARTGAAAPAAEGGIVGRARSLRAALDVARRVAPSALPVLIEGESGTGKELFARYLHDRSERAAGPFVAINCGALPESLVESELFGHVRGAFTGALRDHPGVFRAAHGGTLLLDEIGELPARVQTRLLRVLQEHEVRAVGGGAAIPVDVRVVAATNRDLEQEVEAGRFRRDLYFRLVGVKLRLPPLRERREDIPALAEAALVRIAKEPGMRRLGLGRDALAGLVAHAWPGNVRELEQALRRAVAIADGDELRAFHFELGGARGETARRASHEALDRGLVERALRAADGNRTTAARALGVSRVTLHRCIARLGLDVPARRGRPRAEGKG